MTTPYQAMTEHVKRTIVVGDIHGCWGELQSLIEATGFGTGDVLVTVGDFLDRGPDSWAVARFIRNTPNVFSVIGNHERRVAGVVRGRSQPAWSQRQTLALLPSAEWEEWAGWLEALPAVIETPHAIVTHARLDPMRPLTDQESHFTAAVGGAAVTIELDAEGVPLWFRQMDIQKPVCMGHIGYERVMLVPAGLYALDTRAVGGGQFTAVVFPGGDVVQVPVARNYHQEAREAWLMTQTDCAGDPMSWTLAQVVEALNVRDGDTHELAGDVNVIEQAVAGLELAGRTLRMRESLVKRFGTVPAPGPERGVFFMRVKSAFEERGIQTVAVRLFRDGVLTLDDLAAAFPKVKLNQAAGLLDRLESAINRYEPVRKGVSEP